MKKQIPAFHNLRNFAAFLIDNFFQELVKEDLRKNKESELPLLRYFKGYSEEELLAFTSHRIREFLRILTKEHPIELSLQSLEIWRNNKIPGLVVENIRSTDLVQGFNNRRQTLLTFLPSYTSDVKEAVAIAKELEEFYAILESECFRIFLEIEKQKEKELLTAMEIARIGSYNWHFKDNIITVTTQLHQIFGFDKNERLSFESFVNAVHPDDKEMFTGSINEAIENKWSLDVEYRIVRRDGEERIVWGRGETTYVDGQPLMIQGTILDVTEKRLTEIEVQYREAQLTEAQAIAGIGSFDWDFVNNKSSCTAELYRIFGWPHDRELNFRTFEELSHPDDIEKVFLSLHNAMEHKAPYDCEYRIILPDNSQKWVWARGKVTFDDNGNGIRLTGTVLDITERKLAEEEINRKNQAFLSTYQQLEIAQAELQQVNMQLEERVKKRTRDLELSVQEQKKSALELQAKNEQLEKINADLDNFIYTASHDLKAPITNIEGLVNLISRLEDKNDPRFDRFIEMIYTSINRFKGTIKDLTEISKVQKEFSEAEDRLDLQAVLEDALFDIRETISRNNASIKTDFAVRKVRFSRKNLRSIFYNLVSNAVKFRSEEKDPEISVISREEGSSVVITITDNGLGIPAGKEDKVFTMFKRLHSHVDGSGVGLYIVKRMVDNAGGSIEVQSKAGKGTSFTIRLPQKSASAPAS